jgi:hypothetical protein
MQDFELENQLAQQRYQQALAEQQKPLSSPQGKMVGNIYVRANPLEGLIQGLRMKQAKDELGASRQELKALQGKRQSAIADALRQYTDKATGAPAFQAAGPAQQGAQMADPLGFDGGAAASSGGYTVPERKPDMRAAYGALMNAPDAAMRSAGMTGMARIPEMEAAQQERVDARNFRQTEADLARQARADEAAANRAQRMQELQMRSEDQRNSQAERLQAQRDMQKMQIENQREMRQMMQANRPERQAQIIQTEQGPMQLVGGQAVPIMGPGGVPVKAKAGPEKEPTEGERKAGTLLTRLRGSQAQLDEVTRKNPSAASPNVLGQALSGIGMESAGNLLTSSDRQRVNAAQLDLLDSALTLGTGAAYTREQLEGYRKSYFPQIGDSAATIKDKQDRLNNVIAAAEVGAGRAEPQSTPKFGPGAQNQRAPAANPQDAEALQWARSNPNDPRSRAILQRLGQ